MAKYRFHQKSYVGDRIVEKGEEADVGSNVKPGPHMEPLDDEARAAAEAGGVKFTGEVPDVLNALLPMLQKAQQNADDAAKLTPAALSEAFASALERVLGKGAAAKSDADIQAEVDRRVAEALATAKADGGKGKKGGGD
jgi:hypothetical protein